MKLTAKHCKARLTTVIFYSGLLFLLVVACSDDNPLTGEQVIPPTDEVPLESSYELSGQQPVFQALVGSSRVAEVGKISARQANTNDWHLVDTLINSYQNPVVIIQPPSYFGGHPGTISIRNVTSDSFEFQLDEWDYLDGAHTTEHFGYMVIDAGSYTLANGQPLEAGLVEANHSFAAISFQQTYTTPVVLSQAQTYRGNQAIVTRQRPMANGFEVRVQEEQANDGRHATETIGYIAIEAGYGNGSGLAYEAGLSTGVTHRWQTLTFSEDLSTTGLVTPLPNQPLFLGNIQSYNDPDPAAIRYRNLSYDNVQVFVEEEKSADRETKHAAETVGWLVFETGFESLDPNPNPDPQPDPGPNPSPWAFEETFDLDPSSPSQDLLPRTFDYVVTHRSHEKEHFTKTFGPYPADHGDDCAGPSPDTGLLPQHDVISSHLTNGGTPDDSFFICKNHMMSSMGDVSPYSVASFWPKQDFDFSNGGVLEFDVNINDMHRRSWWEIMITPRDELKVGAARVDLPIDETYPKDHIVFIWGFVEADSSRYIQVGRDQLAPEGLYVEAKDPRTWRNDITPKDPALSDRRIRRTMRISLQDNQIIWEVEKEDGSFDPFIVDVPGGLPFEKGLVVFKTHAYTPIKDGNTNTYTFHWDNIRFSGPVTGKYKTYEAAPEDVVYLQRDGDREIGESQEVTINMPEIGQNPVLFGQVHSPQEGQVLLSINGAAPQVISPYDYEDNPGCYTDGWNSFRLELDPAQLRVGENTFNWTIGERPACSNNRYYPWDSINPITTGSGFYPWNGFSIKNLEIQVDE